MARIEAGPNQLVSLPRPAANRNEVWVAASHQDADSFVATFHGDYDPRNAGGCETMVTNDGGVTWRQAMLDGEHDSFDPTVVAGPDGQFYASHCAWVAPQPEVGTWHGVSAPIRVYTSLDEGATWSAPLELPTPMRPDHQRMAVDTTGGRFHGRVYIAWVEFPAPTISNRIHLFLDRLDAEGRSLGKPTLIHALEGFRPVSEEPVVLSDGTLLVPIWHQPTQYYGGAGTLDPRDERVQVSIARSTDGGETFEEPVKVVESGLSVWPTRLHRFAGVTNPMIFAGDTSAASPHRDNVYAVWGDVRAGSSTDIWLVRSTDGGQTWSEPVRVNDFAEQHDETAPPDVRGLPTVVVNADGVVGVSWYDRRDDPTRRAWQQYFTASLDGGVTFLPNVAVSTAVSQPARDTAPIVEVYSDAVAEPPTWDELRTAGSRITAQWRNIEPWRELARQAKARIRLDAGLTDTSRVHVSFDPGRASRIGDYSGLAAAADGSFLAVWVDSRRGNQEIYSARIRVLDGDASSTASQETLNDRVEPIVGDVRFDEAAAVTTMQVRLANHSAETIHPPLTLRVRDVVRGSEVSAGTEWDFSDLLGTQRKLYPGEATEPQTIELRSSPDDGLDIIFDYDITGGTA